MKKIEAFVKSIRLAQVMLALHEVEGLTGMTTTQAHGFGRGHGPRDAERYGDTDMVATVRIEVFCRDELVATIVSEIQKAAHTGLHGDGKIYVIPVEHAVRISTGEQGQDAI